MLLNFEKQFVQKILNGEKISTIRKDSTNRWKEGNKIHFASGPYKPGRVFMEGICTGIKQIAFNWFPVIKKLDSSNQPYELNLPKEEKMFCCNIIIDGNLIYSALFTGSELTQYSSIKEEEMNSLNLPDYITCLGRFIQAEGFESVKDFFQFREWKFKNFEGKLISWT